MMVNSKNLIVAACGIIGIGCVTVSLLDKNNIAANAEPAAKIVSLEIPPSVACQHAENNTVASIDQGKLAHPPAKENTANPRTLSRQVIPVAINDILPQLTDTPADWRAFKPDKISIAPYPGQEIDFFASEITEEGDRTVWVGRTDKQGAFLVTVAAADHWYATMALPGMASTYQFRIDNGKAAEIIIPSALETCLEAPTAEGSSGKDYMIPPELKKTDSGKADDQVDVLVFYDADVLSLFGLDAERVKTRAREDIASGNEVLKNSNVTKMRWRLIETVYQVPKYTRANDLAHDLEVFSNYLGTQETEVGKFAQEKAGKHGADQIMLYLGDDADPDYWGMAWGDRTAQHLCHESVSYYGGSYLTSIHELAHNFGCMHDRTLQGAQDNDGQYNYGYVYGPGNRQGTMMSYASSQYKVPAFSNPNVTYEGMAIGVVEGQPRAANNARVLEENGPLMAGYNKSTIGSNETTWKNGPVDPNLISNADGNGGSGGGAPGVLYIFGLTGLLLLKYKQPKSRKS